MSSSEPEHQPQGQTPPGWYPSSPGWQRYWDGYQWTEHQAPLNPVAQQQTPGASDDRTMALLIHLLGAFVSILAPIIFYAVKKDESPFVRHHAAEAINFHITIYLGFVISIVLALVLIGFFLMIALVVWFYVATIIAAIAANRGEWYQYPLTIRIVT